MKKPPHFARAMSYGLFDGTLAAAIHLFKFKRVKRLRKPLGDLLLSFDIPNIDALVPVPLTVRGLRERGFNQSLLLAKTFADKTRRPFIMDGLLKITDTAPQIGLSKNERHLNLRGAFRTTRKFQGMKLLLIDDVMTTCSTADECSKALLRAGASEVTVLTLARANYL
jgi:ComF family protein